MYKHPRTFPWSRHTLGFSLIEVMVAVVILATGLLALAALQGALARNSGDAKARSAILAAMTSRMSEIRQGDLGCTPAPAAAPVGCEVTWSAGTDWLDDAAAQAGASNLTVQESIEIHYWNATDKAFENAFIDDVPSVTRAVLEASWTGAEGSKTLVLSSDLSGRIYGDGTGYPNPDEDSSASVRPVVRQDNPGNEAGVIPIAVSDDPDSPSTAASNPKPLLVGDTRIVGTQFDVLSYIPEGELARLTRRINTNLVKCRCEFGQTSPNLGVSGTAQWPTVWNGERYETYKPTSTSAAPGVLLKAGEDPAYAGAKNRTQSPLCTECCRDHHDGASGEKYSPEGVATKYNLKDGELVPATSGKYLAACRIIKSDGLWKTASDAYVRQYGLLATTPSPSDTSLNASPTLQAKDGAPDKRATKKYQAFIRGYLDGYQTSIDTRGDAPSDTAAAKVAYEAYDGGYLQLPEVIEFANTSDSAARYLHSRGLLVDHLSAGARTVLKKVLADCKKTDKMECLLPQLPFTTVNSTELANWSEQGGYLDVVNSGTLLDTDVSQPFGGRTRGIAPVASADVKSTLYSSNSGLAFSHDLRGAVRLDEVNLEDKQAFKVGGTAISGFKVLVAGFEEPLGTLTVTRSSPAPRSSCTLGVGGFGCPTNSLPASITLELSNFNKSVGKDSPDADRVSATCLVNKELVSFVATRPYDIAYATVSAGIDGAAKTSATVRSGVASWTSPAAINATNIINVEMSGRAKLCPATYRCNNNSATVKSWGTPFTAAACDLPPVNSGG